MSHKLTLFRDVVQSDGKTTSTTQHQTLRNSPVQYITTSGPTQTSAIGDVIAVCQNGEIINLSGETLAVQWTSPTKSAVQDVSASTVEDFEVDFVTSGTVSDFEEGIFKHRAEVFTALPKNSKERSTLVALATRSFSKGQETRQFVVLAVAAGSASATGEVQRLTPLDVMPLSNMSDHSEGPRKYRFEAKNGLLLQLQQGAISVFDLMGAVPRLKSIIQVGTATTFARLSRPFVLSCSLDSIALYNYQYRSVHASTSLDLSGLPAENQDAQTCELISYFHSQDLVVALVDNVLVCIQVEPPRVNGKRRKAGLLIDSIGRGTAVEIPQKKLKVDRDSAEFSRKVPGTVTESYLAQHQLAIEAADALLSEDDIPGWEEFLRGKFQIKTKSDSSTTKVEAEAAQSSDTKDAPEWDWLLEPSAYPNVDRRWVIYAISRVFVAQASGSGLSPLKLHLDLPDSNVTNYLAVAGHLNLWNLHSAFREELEANVAGSHRFANDIIDCLAEADPSMTLLLNYLQATKLGEVEVLLAIRALMLSMDLIPTIGSDNTKLLTNEPHQEDSKDEMDLDDLEREIAITEHYLGDESSSRSRGLTLAFTKLWRLPARTTIKALRTALQTEEILSLIHLLRVELVQGAWTSLYIDPTSFDAEGSEAPPDGVIALIADLLGRCLDAIGAGGWLLNDAVSNLDVAESGDFITALKLEVTAALEGIQEAVFLNGVVGESVHYGLAAQNSGAARQGWNTNKPVPVHVEGRESRMLPLGLKTKQLPTREKVVSGGEVLQRTMRETGHLISQKVDSYTLEKLVV